MGFETGTRLIQWICVERPTSGEMAPAKGWKKALLLHFTHLVLIQLYPPAASSALSAGQLIMQTLQTQLILEMLMLVSVGPECFSTNSQGQKKNMHYFIVVNQFHLFQSSHTLQKENILSQAYRGGHLSP